MFVLGDVARLVDGSLNACAVSYTGNCENSCGGVCLAAVIQAAHPPRRSTAAAPPAPKPHREEPPPIAARSRWSPCRACAEIRCGRLATRPTRQTTTGVGSAALPAVTRVI